MVGGEGLDTEGGVNAVDGKGWDGMLYEGTDVDGVPSEGTKENTGGRGTGALTSMGAWIGSSRSSVMSVAGSTSAGLSTYSFC